MTRVIEVHHGDGTLEGRIQYLGDCTHAMAGQTIELPPFER